MQEEQQSAHWIAVSGDLEEGMYVRETQSRVLLCERIISPDCENGGNDKCLRDTDRKSIGCRTTLLIRNSGSSKGFLAENPWIDSHR